MDILNLITQFFPVDARPWIVAALRHDPVVWSEIHDGALASKLQDQLAHSDSFQPESCSPGALALLSLELPLSPQTLRAPGKLALEHDQQKAAHQGLAALASQVRPPTLAQAGLAALSWRIQFDQKKSWQPMLENLLANPQANWAAPLACLFHFSPQPAHLVKALLGPGAPAFIHRLALHMLLSNPLPPDEVVSLLLPCTDHSTLGSGKLSAGEHLRLLRCLSAQRPGLSRLYSQRCLETTGASLQERASQASLAEATPGLLEFPLLLAELYRTQELPEHSLAFLSSASAALYHLVADLHAQSAQLGVASPGLVSGLPAEVEQNWRTAAQGYPNHPDSGKTSHLPGLILHLLALGKLDQAQALLPARANLPATDLPLQVAAVQCALHAEKCEDARQIALQALHAWQSADTSQAALTPAWIDSLPIIRLLPDLLAGLGLHSEAAQATRLLLNQFPADPDLLSRLSSNLSKIGDANAALQAIQVAASLSPECPVIKQQFIDCLENLGCWGEALTERQNLLAAQTAGEHTASLKDWLALAHCALQAGQPEISLPACQQALQLAPEDGRAYLYQGQAHFSLGHLDQALHHLVQATLYSPELPQAWVSLAEVQTANQQEPLALETLRTAAQALPGYAEIFLALGTHLLAANNPTQALAALQQAARLDPSDPQVALLLGQTQISLGFQEDALQVLANAYHQSPHYPGLAYAYAQALLTREAYAQAISPLEAAVASSPAAQHQEIRVALGQAILAAWGLGDPSALLSRAIDILQQALAIPPSPPHAQALLAEALFANGEYTQSLKAYQIAFETDLPQTPEWASRLPLGLGRAALALGQLDTAIAALQEACQADPTNPAIYQALSKARQGARLTHSAYQAACAAVDVSPDDADILLWFAEQVGQLYPLGPAGANPPAEPAAAARMQALQALQRATQIAPQRADVHLRLAAWQLQAGEQSLAVQSYKRVFDAEFNTSADLQAAGAALLQFGETRTAIDCLERSVEFERQAQGRLSPGLLASLARAYRQAGSLELALEHLEQALPLDPRNPALYLEKANLLRDLHQDENALQCLEQGLENTPLDHQQARLHMAGAQIRRSQGNLPAAQAHAQQGLYLCQTHSPQNQGHMDFQRLHLSLLNLTADLQRALLQPEQALHSLEQDAPHGTSNLDPATPEALDYLCLRAELVLEAGDPSGRAPTLPAVTNPSSQPRWLALHYRLAVRRPDISDTTLEEMQKSIECQVAQAVKSSQAPTPVGQCLALFDACMDLWDWKAAGEIVDYALEHYPAEPLIHLAQARWITLQAEFQHLCQACQVIAHAPGSEALAAPRQNNLLDALETTDRLLNDFHAHAQIAKALGASATNPVQITSLQTLPPNPTLVRWQVRGLAAFSTRSQDIDQILPTIYRRTGKAFQFTAEDAAALIAALSRLSPSAGASSIIKTILQAARPYPQHPLVLIQVAIALSPINPSEALKTARAAIKQSSTSAVYYTALANALGARLAHLSSDYTSAQAFIEYALSIWPEEPRWQFLAADICAGAQKPDLAVTHLESAVQQDPTHLAAHMALGRSYLSAPPEDGQSAQLAIPVFQRAAHLAPQSPEPLICLAQAQLRAHLLQEAAQSAEKAAALGDDTVEALLILADISLQQGEPQASLGYAQSAYQQNPAAPEAVTRLAQALHELQRTDEAIQTLEKAIPGTSDALPLQILRADLLRQSGKADEALEIFKALALQKTASPQVFALLAKALAEQDDLPASVRAAQRAVQTAPKDMSAAEKGELHALLGHLMRLSGQLDQATHHLSKAVQLIPNALEPYLELGLARKERREYAQALQVFQRATAIAPQDPRPHYQAGLTLKDSKDYREAEAMLRRAASLAPEDVNIRKQLAAVVALNLVHNPKPRGTQR